MSYGLKFVVRKSWLPKLGDVEIIIMVRTEDKSQYEISMRVRCSVQLSHPSISSTLIILIIKHVWVANMILALCVCVCVCVYVYVCIY